MTQPQQPGIGVQVRVPKMAELVASRLRKQIIDGDLLEGDALPSEAVLMEQFGVSRPTLREAFRVLESESLITVRRGAHGGARVHMPRSDGVARYAALVLEYRSTSLRDVYAARAVLEPACVIMAAQRRTRADLDQLWASVEEAERSLDEPLRLIEHQTAFHKLLVRTSGNQTLLLLYEMVQSIIELSNISHVSHDAGSPENVAASKKGLRAHRRLVELIDSQDEVGATRLWRRHLDEAEVYLLGSDDPVTVLELLG